AGRRDDHVPRVEVEAEPRRAALEHGTGPLRSEVLEEVLDEVLLRQTFEHLDLLDRDGGLVRDGAREVELTRPRCDERAEELVARHERDGDAGRPAAAAELRAEL